MFLTDCLASNCFLSKVISAALILLSPRIFGVKSISWIYVCSFLRLLNPCNSSCMTDIIMAWLSAGGTLTYAWDILTILLIWGTNIEKNCLGHHHNDFRICDEIFTKMIEHLRCSRYIIGTIKIILNYVKCTLSGDILIWYDASFSLYARISLLFTRFINSTSMKGSRCDDRNELAKQIDSFIDWNYTFNDY